MSEVPFEEKTFADYRPARVEVTLQLRGSSGGDLKDASRPWVGLFKPERDDQGQVRLSARQAADTHRTAIVISKVLDEIDDFDEFLGVVQNHAVETLLMIEVDAPDLLPALDVGATDVEKLAALECILQWRLRTLPPDW